MAHIRWLHLCIVSPREVEAGKVQSLQEGPPGAKSWCALGCHIMVVYTTSCILRSYTTANRLVHNMHVRKHICMGACESSHRGATHAARGLGRSGHARVHNCISSLPRRGGALDDDAAEANAIPPLVPRINLSSACLSSDSRNREDTKTDRSGITTQAGIGHSAPAHRGGHVQSRIRRRQALRCKIRPGP